ncbi:unnamed protein product [Amaranthus hypochondriacus]
MQQETMTSSKTMNRISSPAQYSDIFNPPPYSSIFFHSTSSPTSIVTSSKTSSYDNSTPTKESVANAAAKNLSILMSEHKDLMKRHALCLKQLQKTFKEAENLRQENTNLRMANLELGNQVNLLIQTTLKNRYQTVSISDYTEQSGSSSLSSSSEKFGGGYAKERENEGLKEGFVSQSQSPTKLTMENSESEIEKDEEARVTLPKSISVRSNGFLKMNQTSGAGNNSSLSPATRIRAPSPVSGPQKVYVRGGSKKDGPIELEVYNQGMFKTELCNKWQETGTCPYGDHCQYAHGINELRPVIRHPRYKTEVCRMVLAGDPCPYGHRCHFRHALTDEEKLMLPLRLD